MNWIEIVVSEFGRQIGINGLALDSSQKLQLDSDDGLSIGMINASTLPLPELVIFVAKPAPLLNEALLKSAMLIPGIKNSHIWPLQIATVGPNILVAVRIPQRSISISVVNEAIITLKNMLEKNIY